MTPTGRVHDLKTWPEYFQAIWEGRKPFEYRLNDRQFEVGDVLKLREWVPNPLGDDEYRAPNAVEGHYTGRAILKRVTYILDDRLGPTMREGFVVMGLASVVQPDGRVIGLGVTPAMVEAAGLAQPILDELTRLDNDYKRTRMTVTNKDRAGRITSLLIDRARDSA